MKNYIIWVMVDNPDYMKLEFLNETVENDLYWAQMRFIEKGYIITNIDKTADGRHIITLYQTQGASDYKVVENDAAKCSLGEVKTTNE